MSQTPPPIPPDNNPFANPSPNPNPNPGTPPLEGPASIQSERAQAEQDAPQGKALAVVSYIFNFVGLPFFVVPMIMRDNAFSLYHSKQCLVLWIVAIVGAILSYILTFVCIGIFLGIGLLIFNIVINIIGLINAINGKAKPLPLIGTFGEQWFLGMTKK